VSAASSTDVVRQRLRSQALAGSATPSPVDVVERMLAMQAQDLRWAKWAVAIRSPGTTEADVDALIDSGRIVRSWPMRGTLHFVPGHELTWMLSLTTPRLWAGSARRRRELDLDEALIERARTVAFEVLSGGRQLSRADFLTELDRSGIDASGQRGYHLIWHLAQSGTLCWGRQVGAQQLLTLLQEWVPVHRALEPDEALGEFLLRYLTGHGPATVADFAWWAQVTGAQAKVALAVIRPRLVEWQVDGVSHYLPVTADTASHAWSRPGRGRDAVLALPGFDEYYLGYQDRRFAADPADFDRVVPGKNGIFLPALLRHGRVIGTWRREWKPRLITVQPQPFAPETPAEAQHTDRALREYARFLDRPVTVLPSING
jgi:hypothetical protein